MTVRRMLLAHGAPALGATWLAALVVVLLVGRMEIALDALVGGRPRSIPVSDVIAVVLAAALPGLARSRMTAWEAGDRIGLLLGKSVLATVVLLAAPALVRTATARAGTAGEGWQATAGTCLLLSAIATVLTSRGVVAGGAPIVLSSYLACTVVRQHVPASAEVLALVVAPTSQGCSVAILVLAAVVAVAAAASPQLLRRGRRAHRESLKRGGLPSLRARVASSKLSVRIRR